MLSKKKNQEKKTLIHLYDEYIHRKKTERKYTKISTMVIFWLPRLGMIFSPYIFCIFQISLYLNHIL